MGRRLTFVIEVLSELHVAVASGSDMKVALYFVALQTSE